VGRRGRADRQDLAARLPRVGQQDLLGLGRPHLYPRLPPGLLLDLGVLAILEVLQDQPILAGQQGQAARAGPADRERAGRIRQPRLPL
jgi:hypothetical protein